MMIQNISNQNIFRPQMQNAALKKIVSQLNINAAKKQSFDTVELSKKALALLKENNNPKEKEPVLDYENSDMVSSERYGNRSKAEFAEMSLTVQRDSLKAISDKIDYHKSKLEFTMGKISELESYLNGTAPHSNPDMTKDRAEALLHNYKQSIIDDFTNLSVKRDQFTANEFDELSGGLAGKIFENPLNSLNEKTLGLDNLSSDPKEIMMALENASKVLDKMTSDLESAFSKATGGKEFTKESRNISIFNGNSSHDFFESQMENTLVNEEISVSNFDLSGKTLNVDLSTLINV